MTDIQTGRKMPFSVLAEQALLGSLLIDPASLVSVVDKVRPDDFYLPEHHSIYSAILSLSSTSRDIDVITLLDTLEKEKVYDDRAGAEAYLRTLSDSVPSALNVADYARIVVEKSLMRQLIEACDGISQRAYSEQENPDEVLEYAGSTINSISMGRDTRSFANLNQLIGKVLADLEELSRNPEAFEGIKTGYSGLDSLMAGIGSTDLVLIGARPGMGKTALALNIAANVAMNTGMKVAIFSLEMSDEQLAARILSSQAMVSSTAMRTGAVTQDDWARLAGAVDRLGKAKILIDDSSNINVSAMKAKVRREGGVGLVVVDYLQLMTGERKSDNRTLEISEITRNLKLMAKELRVPVICCSQLSRGVESRNSNNKRPQLSDLRESGSIEQDADSVIFIYRDEYYRTGENRDDVETPVAEIIVAKNRHGSTGTEKLNWIGKYTTFYSIDSRRSDSDAPPEHGRARTAVPGFPG